MTFRLIGRLLCGAAISVNAMASDLCGAWQTLDGPNPSVVNRVLHVAGRAPDDLWLLGSAGPTYPGNPMIWRRDGAGWSSIPLPDTSPLGSLPRFNAIAQLPNGDLLVGGDVRTSYPIDNQPFVARWNGSEWEVTALTLRPQDVYPYGARGGLVADIFVAAPDDIWVVGHAASLGSGGSVAMAVHFNGSNWTEVETPVIGNRTNEIIAVDGSAPGDVWAVGVQRDIAGAYKPYIMHWDAENWEYFAVPADALGSLDAVGVASATDAWALNATQFFHWDGYSWQPAPRPSGASSAAIAANAADDVWVAHFTSGYFHWNGSDWAFAASPFSPPQGWFTQIRDFVRFGACDVWSAGSVLALDGSAPSTTIVEHLASSATAGDMNCDGSINGQDISPFRLALSDPDQYAQQYPDCDLHNADTNRDGSVNGLDIQGFVELLLP